MQLGMSALAPKTDMCSALILMSAKCQKRTFNDRLPFRRQSFSCRGYARAITAASMRSPVAPFATISLPEVMAERTTDLPEVRRHDAACLDCSEYQDRDRHTFECPACKTDFDILLVREPLQ